MKKTKLNKLTIKNFRALKNTEISFADRVTVICGKNGTSKSSILGIAAQIFSFSKNYTTNTTLNYSRIDGGQFKSQYSEHFRISNAYDTPGSMDVDVEIYDGYTEKIATATLELMKRGNESRPVVRKNSTVKGKENTSRNFTHPVIFLSLKRLYPIADRKYEIRDYDYLNANKSYFTSLSNEILNQTTSEVTGTSGTISSAVTHGSSYDQDSVSAGEDNVGQIVLALMSFKKLKEEYPEYKGGLLLIDEADASLFPAAQINLMKILKRECANLDIQVIITSHSPTLIQYAYEQAKEHEKFKQREIIYEVVYISNTFGETKVMTNWSWFDIYADINTKTAETKTSHIKLPKINVYFEDGEAEDLFSELIRRQPIVKFLNKMTGINLGCKNYMNLIEKEVPEFSRNSIVCLDADQNKIAEKYKSKTIIILPGSLPPDQHIFEYLYNLPASNDFWKNGQKFTRDVFTNESRNVINSLDITGDKLDLAQQVEKYNKNKCCGKEPIREIFKKFYTSPTINRLMKSGEKPCNPWRSWAEANPNIVNQFLDKLYHKIQEIMGSNYGVQSEALTELKIKHRKDRKKSPQVDML